MGIFKKKKIRLKITENDRNWVEDNIKWLIRTCGLPDPDRKQILLTEEYFPATYEKEKFDINSVIIDLSKLLDIKGTNIKVDFVEDIRDSYGVPYEIGDEAFESDMEYKDDTYIIYAAKYLEKFPGNLIHHLILEFVKIKMMKNEYDFDNGNDTEYFVYLAAIYFGFGLILINSHENIGYHTDGFWETKWNYSTPLPMEVVAYCFGLYLVFIKDDIDNYTDYIPKDFKGLFFDSFDYIAFNSDIIKEDLELETMLLYYEAWNEIKSMNIEKAINLFQKIRGLTNDILLQSELNNNIGYYLCFLNDYEAGKEYLEQSIRIYPDDGYAYNNLAYICLKTGDYETGKEYIEKALATSNYDLAYIYRNYAIYYMSVSEYDSAEEYFQKAFESAQYSVDLLDYHYAEFLFIRGKKEEGMKYLIKAANKKEPDAIKRLAGLN